MAICFHKKLYSVIQKLEKAFRFCFFQKFESWDYLLINYKLGHFL